MKTIFSHKSLSRAQLCSHCQQAQILAESARQALAPIISVMEHKLHIIRRVLNSELRFNRSFISKKSVSLQELKELHPQLEECYRALTQAQKKGSMTQFLAFKEELQAKLNAITLSESFESQSVLKIEEEVHLSSKKNSQADMSRHQLIQKLHTYHRAKKQERKHYEAIVVANSALVVKIVSKHFNYHSMGKDDLIQEGCLGLIAAIKQYDYEGTYTLSTFATPIIQQHIRRALYNKERAIRLPLQTELDLNKIKQSIWQLEQSHREKKPQAQEIAQHSQLPLTQVEKLLPLLKQSTMSSLQEYKDEQTATQSLWQEHAPPTPLQSLIEKERQDIIINHVTQLTAQERHIIELRYGLKDSTYHTHQEIGDLLKISRSKVIRAEKQALLHLRNLMTA